MSNPNVVSSAAAAASTAAAAAGMNPITNINPIEITSNSVPANPASTLSSNNSTTNTNSTSNTNSNSTNGNNKTSTNTTTSSSSSSSSKAFQDQHQQQNGFFWEWNIELVKQFLKKPIFNASASAVTAVTAVTAATAAATTASDGTATATAAELSDQQRYETQTKITNVLLENICKAIESASTATSTPTSTTTKTPTPTTSSEEPPSKKRKTETPTSISSSTSSSTKTTPTPPTTTSSSSPSILKRDLYNILDSGFAKGDTIVHIPGTILSRLTIGGLINALAGQFNGIVNVTTTQPLPPTSNIDTDTDTSSITMTTTIPTAYNLTIQKLKSIAILITQCTSAKLEYDMMTSTPQRIINLLCPELTKNQISSIRHRVVETVMHGRGTNTSHFLQSIDNDNVDDIPTTKTSISTHENEKFKKCHQCGNNNQSEFVTDRKNGDVICTNCGMVIYESLMHEGSMYRKFEGEEDRNHHGSSHNPLYSNAYNMGTSLSGVGMNFGAGLGGYGSSTKATSGNIENILKRVHDYTEMNISQMGKEERKTRIGYKDRQKKDAFVQMNHVGDALSLHSAVIQRAKELFAGFRDDRELLQQFKGVIAACICEAFDQLSMEGRQILNVQASVTDDADDDADDHNHENNKKDGSGSGSSSGNGITNGDTKKDHNGNGMKHKIKDEKFNKRATRRNELHSSNLAGQNNGFILNIIPPNHTATKTATTTATTKSQTPTTPKTPTSSSIEEKTVTTWNLDDARIWLLETSRIIAQKWFTQQDEIGKPGSITTIGNIPKGTKDELEGVVLQYALSLCGVLESELNRNGNGKNRSESGIASASGSGGIKSSSMSMSSSRVVTPRFNEMGNLSIRWQHKHERGSGGAGGVGFSGRVNSSSSSNGGGGKPHGSVNISSGIKSNVVRGGAGRIGTGTGGGRMGSTSKKTTGQILRLKTAAQLSKAIGDPTAGEAFYRELKALLGRQDAKLKKERSNQASIRRMNQMKRKPEIQARVQL